MIRLNLLPNAQRDFQETKQGRLGTVRIVRLGAAAVVGITVLLAVWVYGVQAVQKKLLTDSIKERYHTLRAVKDIDTYATIQNQLASLTALHDDKNLVSRLLDYLPSISGGARLNRVALVDTNHSLVFEGEATDYKSLVMFRDTLRGTSLLYTDLGKKQQKQPFFTSVTIQKSNIHVVRATSSYISFTIIGHYQDVAFKRSAINPSLSIPKKETTQSVLAAPLVFEETRGVQP